MIHKTNPRIALVTGASSGFGREICTRLISDGYVVIAAARRIDRLQQLHYELGSNLHPLELDIRDLDTVARIKEIIPEHLHDIDLLINNAGLALGIDSAQKANLSDWLTMIETNVIGLTCMTHAILPGMVKRQSGHIINIGSIAGTYPYPGGNVYGATKAYVAQFSLNLRADLAGTSVRVSDVQPGLCGGTEFSAIRFHGDSEKAQALYANVEPILPADIAEAVAWIAALPKHVNINTIEIMPTAQSFSALQITRNIK